MKHSSFYIDSHDAPSERLKHCENGVEHHFTEASIQIAFAMYLFGQGATKVQICPDGQHLARHDLRKTLETNGFHQISSQGSTACGGEYVRDGALLRVFPGSGEGDVTAQIMGRLVFAECKGGIINTRNAGQTSRLRKGLCEVIGQLISRDLGNERHIAVVPDTAITRRLASQMKQRANTAGIEIALVSADGAVHFQ